MSLAVLVAVNVAAFAFVVWFAWWWGRRNRRPVRQVVPLSELMAQRSLMWTLREISQWPCSHGDAVFTCPDMNVQRAEWCPSCIAHEALNFLTSSIPVSSTPGVEDSHPRNGTENVT